MGADFRSRVESSLTNGLDSLAWRGAFGSAKIERLVEDALRRGLVVDFVVEDKDWFDETVFRSVQIEVHRPRVDPPANMLDVVQNADRVFAGWAWVVRNGNTPKMHSASKLGYGVESRDLTARTLPHVIATMGIEAAA